VGKRISRKKQTTRGIFKNGTKMIQQGKGKEGDRSVREASRDKGFEEKGKGGENSEEKKKTRKSKSKPRRQGTRIFPALSQNAKKADWESGRRRGKNLLKFRRAFIRGGTRDKGGRGTLPLPSREILRDKRRASTLGGGSAEKKGRQDKNSWDGEKRGGRGKRGRLGRGLYASQQIRGWEQRLMSGRRTTGKKKKGAGLSGLVW